MLSVFHICKESRKYAIGRFGDLPVNKKCTNFPFDPRTDIVCIMPLVLSVKQMARKV